MENRAATLCRVCLGSERAMYRLTDTALRETYERVTRENLIEEGRPCCVCGVCLSALRRCRRFVEVAHRANKALDQWINNQGTIQLAEHPMYSLSRSPFNIITISSDDIDETKVKQENYTPVYKQNDNGFFEVQMEAIPHEESFDKDIKYEINQDDNTLKPTCNMFVKDYSAHEPEISNDYENTEFNEIDVKNEAIPGSSDIRRVSKTLQSRKRTKNDDRNARVLKKHRSGIKLAAEKQEKRKKIQSYSCSICEYKTTKKWHLQEHIIVHTKEKPFMCDKCAFKCGRKTELKKHLVRHTGQKPFGCDKCDYKCSIKTDLKRHLKKHTGDKPFACHQCDYKSSYKSNLKQHELKHTSDKSFKCDHCEYKTSHERLLKQHLLTHSGEKPFACDKCDYKCSRKGSLKQHSMIHTGNKTFFCNKCDFRAYLKNSLKMHLMIHSGEKPFMCDKCDYKSCRKGELNRHLKIHTGENRFKCDMCDYESRDRRALKRHLKRHSNY